MRGGPKNQAHELSPQPGDVPPWRDRRNPPRGSPPSAPKFRRSALTASGDLTRTDYHTIGKQVFLLNEDESVATRGDSWREHLATLVGCSVSTLNKAARFYALHSDKQLKTVEHLGVGWFLVACSLAEKNFGKRLALLRKARMAGWDGPTLAATNGGVLSSSGGAWLLGTTVESVPADVPYLHAEPGRLAAWSERLSQLPGFKVGVVWQGNPQHPWDRFRSFPLAELAPLAEIPGVRLISLQKGHGSEQVAGLKGRFEVP